MFDLKFDTREFERAAQRMGAALDQVPYAISVALNESAKVARSHEIDTVWPAHVKVRNKGFMRASLATEFANKRKLSVTVFDKLGRASLKKHDKGGTKTGRGKLAIPDRKVRRGSKGVVASQRPGALPNSFRKGDTIYQRSGRKGRRLKLMYTLKPAVQIKADVPFSSEFATVMRREMRARFGPAVAKAMRGRR